MPMSHPIVSLNRATVDSPGIQESNRSGLNKQFVEFHPIDQVSVDEDILARCGWLDEILYARESIEKFLTNGFGTVLIYKGTIVAEAYGMFIGNGACEIGVFTPHEYRNKGLGRMAVAQVVQTCMQRGLIPHWSCRMSNQASLSLASSVGFHGGGRQVVHIYS